MKRVVGLSVVAFLFGASASAIAQEPRGIIQGAGGFSTDSEATAGSLSFLGGVHVARHVLVFGDLGRLANVQPSDSQAAVDAALAAASATNATITGTPRVPAWYSSGGARFELPTNHAVTPYVFGALGFARLSPGARFQYSGTTTLSGGTASAGQDATNDIVSGGYFVAPAAETAAMVRIGGGVQIPLTRGLLTDVGYGFSRIGTQTPVKVNTVTFGLGVRF